MLGPKELNIDLICRRDILKLRGDVRPKSLNHILIKEKSWREE